MRQQLVLAVPDEVLSGLVQLGNRQSRQIRQGNQELLDVAVVFHLRLIELWLEFVALAEEVEIGIRRHGEPRVNLANESLILVLIYYLSIFFGLLTQELCHSFEVLLRMRPHLRALAGGNH